MNAQKLHFVLYFCVNKQDFINVHKKKAAKKENFIKGEKFAFE